MHIAMSVFKDMKNGSISYIILLLLKITSSSSSFTIISGPEDMTVCINTLAKINCGFTGASPGGTIPDWRIVYRNDSGSVINNDTIDGNDILLQRINGLQWVADFDSGILNAPNSHLLVGPVNMTLNQSSYQCMFTINERGGGTNTIMSSVGTMTVVDSPSVIINVDEICTTSINMSLIADNHPACGDVSLTVIISDNIVNPDDDSKYIFDELQSDTLHNITVVSTYNYNGSRKFNQSVRTSSPKLPNPIDTTSIIIEKTNRNSLRIMWKQPKFDRCSMLAINHYEVMIYYGEVEIKAEIIPNLSEQNGYLATFAQNLFDDCSSITITVNVTVIDIIGQRSTTSSVTVTISDTQLQNTTTPSIIDESNASDTNDSQCEIFIGLTVVFIVTSVISTTISVILSWKLCCSQKRADNVATIPTAQPQPKLNVDSIQMQSSPAYVSIDSKSPKLYQSENI